MEQGVEVRCSSEYLGDFEAGGESSSVIGLTCTTTGYFLVGRGSGARRFRGMVSGVGGRSRPAPGRRPPLTRSKASSAEPP